MTAYCFSWMSSLNSTISRKLEAEGINDDWLILLRHSWKRFFRNQDQLKNTVVQKDIKKAIKGVEALILAVPHAPYLRLKPEDIVNWAGGPIAIIDAFGILTDEQIRGYFRLGCEVKALGRGHLARLKRDVKAKKK